MRILVKSLLSYLTVFLLVLVSRADSQTAFFDSSLSPINWDTTSVSHGPGGEYVNQQMPTGGDPDSFLEIASTRNPVSDQDFGSIVIAYIRPDFVYDPQVGGAIDSLLFGETDKYFSFSGCIQAAGPAIRQDSQVFIVDLSTSFWAGIGFPTWDTTVWTGLTETDFTHFEWFFAEIGTPMKPDFSASGSPIEFGFFRSLNGFSGAPVCSTTTGIDNWFVNISGPTCCVGLRGNVNGDILEEIDISDLTYLVGYQFKGGPAPPCEEEADIDGSGGIDIADVTAMVGFQFKGGSPPASCL